MLNKNKIQSWKQATCFILGQAKEKQRFVKGRKANLLANWNSFCQSSNFTSHSEWLQNKSSCCEKDVRVNNTVT